MIEADLDNGAIYASGDTAVGEMYDDSAFDETVTINGGGTVGLTHITLSVASAQRHDGTAGTGARIIRTVNVNGAILTGAEASTRTETIEWLEVTTSAPNNSTIGISLDSGGLEARTLQRTIIHGMFNSAGAAAIIGIDGGTNNRAYRITNNIVYDLNQSNTGAATGIETGAGTLATYTHNNTVHNIRQTNGAASANSTGFTFNDDADCNLQNNIATTVTVAGSGTAACYQLSAPTLAVVSHNLASDTTASGTGSLDSKTAANQFVSIVGGSEDLHLKSGADAIDAGTDLVTTPTGVNFDIDNRDRDAQGDVWDMGADEFVAAAGGQPAMRRLRMPSYGADGVGIY